MLDRFLEDLDKWEKKEGRKPVIFHAYDWGGYITWHAWPELLNWIDDRNEVQGEDRFEEYLTILRAEPRWQEKLRHVDFICIFPDAPLAKDKKTP